MDRFYIPLKFWSTSKKIIAVISCLLLLAFTLIYHVQNRGIEREVLQEIDSDLSKQVTLTQTTLDRWLEGWRYDVNFLHSTPPIKGIVDAFENDGFDPYGNTSLAGWKDRLTTIFTAFLESSPDVYQVRYIMVAQIGSVNSGEELIKVYRRSGNIFTAKTEELQQKRDHQYFKDILQLNPGENYISEFNLNREHNKIEFPFRPTVRFAKPIYNQSNELFAALIINVELKNIFSVLQKMVGPNMRLLLLNSNEQFIDHPDTSYDFSFEMDPKITYSDIYKKVITNKLGIPLLYSQADQKEYFYSSASVYLAEPSQNRRVKLVGLYPREIFLENMARQQKELLWVIGVSGALVILALIGLQSYIANREAVIEAQSKSQAIVNSSVDAIVSVDGEGIVTSWNGAAQDIFGVSRRNALKKSIFEIIIFEGDDFSMESIKHAMSGMTISNKKVQAQRSSGKLANFTISMSPIYTARRSTLGVAITLRDITDQITSERQIQALNQSLNRLVDHRTKELNLAKDQALAASKAKSDFVANISHEIRTPLNGIFGMLKLVQKEDLTEQQSYYISVAESSATALAKLINDFLDLSKIESGKLNIEAIEFDLEKTAGDLFSSLAVGIFAKGVRAMIDFTELNHPALIGDPYRISQIIQNLVGNATKFTDQGEIQLTIATETINEDRVKVTGMVRDTGIGIAAENISLLFQAFSQEDSSITRRFGGTGLGLSICRKLCKLMGGDIQVESHKGIGTTFEFWLVLEPGVVKSEPIDVALDWQSKQILVSVPSNFKCDILLKNLSNIRVSARKSHLSLAALIAEINSASYPVDCVLIDEQLVSSESLAKYEQASTQPDSKLPRLLIMVEIGTEQQTFGAFTSGAIIHKPILPRELKYKLAQWLFHVEKTVAKISTVDAGVLAGKHILVVDDNETNQEVAAGLLEECGLMVTQVYDGEQAIRCLREAQEKPIDLILMDCQMPKLDGYTASLMIRSGEAGENYANLPIIAMTANVMEGDKVRCLQAGMDDYLPKPVDEDALVKKLLYWLDLEPGEIQPKRQKIQAPGQRLAESTKLAESQMTEWQELQDWDRAALFKRARNKEARVRDIVTTFLETLPDRMESLDRAVKNLEFASIEAVAHSLKGSSGTLGAQQVYYLTTELEVAARSQSLETVQLLWLALQESCERLQNNLGKYINPPPISSEI